MFATISPLITRGIIDNTAKDLIDLRLWCIDGREPLHFRLRGNCLRDIAGCKVEFTNNAAAATSQELPAPLQVLRQPGLPVEAGDITLSHREVEKNNRGFVSNVLYLEFYVGKATRILIETNDFSYRLAGPQWLPTWADDTTQHLMNMEALHQHVKHTVDNFRGPGINQMADMPSCEWDAKLNRAEAYMAIYPTIREKYSNEPGGYLSAAYVMDRTAFLGVEAEADEAALPPDPERLARDWDVLDFFEPGESDAVREAMHHPLFEEASRMTGLVQRHIINSDARVRESKEAGTFLSMYAGLISHILSTILLTRQKDYPAKTAISRILHIAKRLRTIPQLCSDLPGNTPSVISNAAERLLQGMRDFTANIPH